MRTPLDYYEQTAVEEDRLTRSRISRLEFLRTLQLLRPRLPSPPGRVLDVGGATGAARRCAQWPPVLAELQLAGSADVAVHGVDGPAWPAFPRREDGVLDDADPTLRAVPICARQIGGHPQMIGMTPHLLGTAPAD